ncbi:ATP-dependent DNA helicase RecG [Salinibacter sp. 10B]|uniref:ATP-dependent DNA helicase RecG n=1 Tax=Salinibacter sp. 10B TaxID=1923971 RepID=UPI000CF4CDFE|nr:ATP-dependent DNA helicase RecG [Salinibacter sp. 10B]PQJ33866.1 ATP-dependent DNA helicase RecG [Salinibacter sp. 10B]
MSDDFLEQDVRYVKGVGEKRANVWADAHGVRTVRDLLHFYPRRYLDRSTITPVERLQESPDPVTVVGTVQSTNIVPGKSQKRFELILQGERGGRMKCTWFQGIWWVRKAFEKGDQLAVHGKVEQYGRWFSMTHPDFDKLNDEGAILDTGRIVPLYPGGEAMEKVGLTSRSIRRILYNLFKEHGLKLQETLPERIVEHCDLMEGRVALRAIHFPKSQSERAQAEQRLKFEELFLIQLMLAQMRQQQDEVAGPAFDAPGEHTKEFVHDVLPFELTGAQKRSLREVIEDTQTGVQMNRLVQGDVGSGKTVVAVAAMMHAYDSGYQSAFMAPTELLAEQHYQNLLEYLQPLGLEPRLLTGSQTKREREEALRALRSGESPVAVGTHAIIQEEVEFDSLGLAVVDEQHRFGVAQRAEMFEKGQQPHMLLMTATPIPRSLAMTLYGDLDVSKIDEMPPGRKPVETQLRSEKRRGEVYAFLRDKLEQGQQAYVVYPLVEESEKMDLKDAENGYENLKKQFPDYTVGLVHGQMKSDQKENAMARFKDGTIDILVSTTVIEVGVDVPNATIMLVEHAERFGLSQLHQLRGRVGRSDQQSYCILMAGYKRSNEAKQRLEAMVRTNDGFEISETDLKIRGAGDFFGTRQSGMPDLKIADITEDTDILEEAREAAFSLVERDPHLRSEEHQRLRRRFEETYAAEGLGFARVG